MKKTLLATISALVLTVTLFGQKNYNTFNSPLLKGFDEKSAWLEIRKKGIHPEDAKGYMDMLKRKYIAKNNPGYSFQSAGVQNAKGIKGPINIDNVHCQNLGFEGYNFANWQAGTWTLSGATWAGTTPIWVNGTVSNGNNAGLTDPMARHTILTMPPLVNGTAPAGPWIGWDSIAINPGTLVSDIPLVCPNGAGVSVRLGNAVSGGETEYLKYSINVNSNNTQFTYNYAVVFQDPGHPAADQPFFKVTMTDQNGNQILGVCGQYDVNASLAATDPSFILAYDPLGWNTIYYRPWTTVSADLTAYIGQTVNIEFRTGDCAYFGHFGYAYIDASCGILQATVNGYCPGNNIVNLVAPVGFTQYQWFGPNSQVTAIPGATNDTLTLNNPNFGDIYYVQCISAMGCTTMAQTSITVSPVGIANIQTIPSCQGGTSGQAIVTATGGLPSGYNFLWTTGPNQTGSTLYNGPSGTITGLAPGTYYVHVTSGTCVAKDTSVVIGIAPPFTLTGSANFCGNLAFINAPAGATNIQWWDVNGVAVPAPGGSALSYTVTNAVGGQVVSCVYDNASGCRDSMRITLNSVAGGYVGHTNIVNVCVGGTNGQATLNLTPATNGPYSYVITGPNGYNNVVPAGTSTNVPLSNLSFGSYTVAVSDSNFCFYSDVFKIDTISIPVTVTASPMSYCAGMDTTNFIFTFMNGTPTSCALSASGCTSTSNATVGTNQYQNSSWDWPAPYGNWYQNSRHQFLVLASELQASGMSAGKINSLSFFVTSLNGTQPYPNFRMSIGCTSLNALPTVPWSSTAGQNFFQTGLTQVWNMAGNYMPVVGINTHTFTQPYEWDGVSNIVIETCFDITNGFTDNCSFQQTYTPFISSVVLYNDPTPVCGNPPVATWSWVNPVDFNTNQNLRPVMQFGWCSAQATPAQFTFNWNPNIGFIGSNQPTTIPTATVNASPNTSTSYTLTTTTNVGGCQRQDVFNVSIVQPFTIQLSVPDTMLCTNDPNMTIQAITTPNTPGTWTGNGITSNLANGQAIYSPALAPVGTNTVTFSGGVAGCVGDTTINLHVHTYTNPSFTPPAAMCDYAPSVNLVATNPGGSWYINGNLNATGVFNPSALSAGTHTVTYVTGYVHPVTGVKYCADSSTATVIVNPKPHIIPSVNDIDGCEGTSSTMSFSSSLPAPSVTGGTYSWAFGDGGTSNVSNPVHNYANAGIYTVILNYTDPNGCVDDSTVTNWIEIYPYTDPSFTPIPGMCEYDPPVNLSATNAGGSWYIDNTLNAAGVFNPQALSPIAGPHTITYVTAYTHPVTGVKHCQDSSKITITVNPKPNVEPMVNHIDGCVITNSTMVFTGNLNAPSVGGGLFTWNFGDNSVSNMQSPVHVYNIAGTFPVTMSYTDPNGCFDDSTVVSWITIYPNPDAGFLASNYNPTILEPSVNFINTTPGTNVYFWDIGGLDTTSLENPSYTFPENPGLYEITLTATNQFGCVDSVTQIVKVEPDYVFYVPNAFSPNGDGKNDIFLPQGFGLQTSDYRMMIFDRWGEKIFETSDWGEGWNGTLKNSGSKDKVIMDTYVYRISYKDLSGKSHIRTGHVTVVK